MLTAAQFIKMHLWLVLSALLTFVDPTWVHADPECRKIENRWLKINAMYEQVNDALEQGQLLPSACDALDAADKIYQLSRTGLLGVEPIGKPKLGKYKMAWIDCDWVSDSVRIYVEATYIDRFRKRESDLNRDNSWWLDKVRRCQEYPTPRGYKTSKVYSGADGLQLALYTSTRVGKPPILAFAGTQDFTDAKANLGWGAPQIREISSLNGSRTWESPWYFSKEPGRESQHPLDKKFQMKTSRALESFTQELARLLIDGKDLVITGHSLGGALAQASAYIIQSTANFYRINPSAQGKIHVYTWNGLGAKEGLGKLGMKIEPAIVDSIRMRNFAVKGDLVPTLGTQLGGESIEIDNQEKQSWLDSLKPKHPTKYHSMDTIHRLYGRNHCREIYAK